MLWSENENFNNSDLFEISNFDRIKNYLIFLLYIFVNNDFFME